MVNPGERSDPAAAPAAQETPRYTARLLIGCADQPGIAAADLERVGRDVERLVMARAVALHLDDRVIIDGRRTIVF